ncbi:hypothetical protein CI109_104701 [Kwoniella shandongensis]|uniref:Uncharacterized protein n=1 Tax=Kwoniella shandongensis TaxID=1734106 RepID=A0A5M6BVI8_9TREE|nr:uncharacterized protein CI109_004864 [Kwoniella shandongensis]KAA5526864.1 hypothetical protein CI109_004864 [Kwoniella shandongensis]
MLYALGFIVILVIILAIWLIRVVAARVNQHKQAHHPRSDLEAGDLPNTTQPHITEVARDVTNRLFPARPEQTGHPSSRLRYASDYAAVTRMPNVSETSLPAYGAPSLPVPPAPVYEQSGRTRPLASSGAPMAYAEAPPKYSPAS